MWGYKNDPVGSFLLLLCFLKRYVFSEFFRIFLKFNLSSNKLLILRSPVDFACFFILELDEVYLCFCHSFTIITYSVIFSTLFYHQPILSNYEQ